MTEPAKDKIQVRKPASYAEVPLPAPNGNASQQTPQVNATKIAGLTGYEHLKIKSIEDAKDPEGDLVSAAGAVFRALTTRIAYHEKQAQRLREALAPFGSMARQSAAPAEAPAEDTVRALLRYAEVINNREDQQ